MHLNEYLKGQLAELKQAGFYKHERPLESPQSGKISVNHKKVLNLCANNYLGLADEPRLIRKACQALEENGYGMASVRFICGTHKLHKELEQNLSDFLQFEDTILYSSCFDANTGLFETLLGPEDAIISDSLNHASIIDGVRLCKAERFLYKNNDMKHLEEQLKASQGARFRVIATDGVFSMDGTIARLPEIIYLKKKYNALLMVDDSHAVGFLGDRGRGSHDYHNVMGEIDIMTGTLGKALGGASGGYTCGSKEVVDWLRQRSRPYLFSNSLAPVIAQTSIAALNLLKEDSSYRTRLFENTQFFREQLMAKGFDVVPGSHPIIPIMTHDAKIAQEMAQLLLEEGIYVVGFSFPVVPKGLARIRTQMSSALSREDLIFAVEKFTQVGKSLNLIS